MKKQIAMYAVCLGLLCSFLYFCSGAANTPATQKSVDRAAHAAAGAAGLMHLEVPIGCLLIRDFWYSEDLYRVVLYRTAVGDSVVRVGSARDKDTLLQEMPLRLPGDAVAVCGFFSSCGSGKTVSGDAPEVCADSPDIVILCRSGSGGELQNFLYLWNWETHTFDTEPVELPADYVWEYYNSLRIFSRTCQEGPTARKTLYQVDDQTKDIVPLRSYALNREEKTLEIRDELRHRVLFSDKILLDADGNPENEEYFDCFFGSLSYITKPEEPDPNVDCEEGIPVFIAEHDEYGYIYSHAVYYPDREALLAAYGFEGRMPFYQYRDAWGDLKTELYFDPATETGCGFYYSYDFYPGQEQIITGYVFQGIEEQAWEVYPPYLLKNRYGETGKEWPEDEGVLSYQEDCRYRTDGRLEYFCAGGLADFNGDGPEETVFLELDFVYRDDGTLACRNYFHNTWMWGTSYSSGTYLYDEKERLLCETLYVTHGGEAFYYIYEDDSSTPAYALMLDNCGTWGCGLYPVKQR